MNEPWLTIVGIGEDGVEGLAPAARAAIRGAAVVVGGSRHLALADPLIAGDRLVWSRPLEDSIRQILERRAERVTVLASGDPFCFGIGGTLARHVAADEMRCHPAVSALSLACARLGWSQQDCAAISFCGRPIEPLIPMLQPGARILALSADASTPGTVAALLSARGFGSSRLYVLESLGGPRERTRVTTAAGYALEDVHALNMVAIEVDAEPGARTLPLTSGLADDLFEHDGQLTKREIRALTLSSLAPRRGELLWDIGCGSGSIGIEWLLRHPANHAIAVEARADRAGRAVRNALALGVPQLQVVHGDAPAALDGLAQPNAIFVGGGAREPAVLDAAWAALPPDGRIVANAVTVETEAALIAARARLGGTLTRVSVERLDRVGSLHGYRPAMTVTQWCAAKP